MILELEGEKLAFEKTKCEQRKSELEMEAKKTEAEESGKKLKQRK